MAQSLPQDGMPNIPENAVKVMTVHWQETKTTLYLATKERYFLKIDHEQITVRQQLAPSEARDWIRAQEVETNDENYIKINDSDKLAEIKLVKSS